MLSEKLLIVIRVLSVLLLLIFIYTGYQGAMIVKELRDTVHSRLAAGQFPVPLGGLPFDGLLDGAMGSDPQGAGLDLSGIKDPDINRQASRAVSACQETGVDACRKEIVLLSNVLKQKGQTADGQLADRVVTAIDAHNEEETRRLLLQLYAALTS